MAGSVALSFTARPRAVERIDFAWTSDAAGAVSGNAIELRGGFILQAQIRPAAAGDAPSDAYDLQLLDAHGADVLGGQGADASATAPEFITFESPFFVDGEQPLQLVVANAGDQKSGVLALWGLF